MKYFDDNGRRVIDSGMRVFSKVANDYYQLEQPELDFELILKRLAGNCPSIELEAEEFERRANNLLGKIKLDVNFSNLTKGVHVPFAFRRSVGGMDLGTELVDILLPNVKKSFNERFPESHFKAVLQSDSKLAENVDLAAGSRYGRFIEACEQKTVVGWYFPQALQEFDVRSQREQMATLPDLTGAQICLSGGMDLCAALVGSPELLISEKFYTPIPIMSAYVHRDERLVLLLKAYGPHLEFWCMTQMLTKDTTQVSEQWTGGVTIYE